MAKQNFITIIKSIKSRPIIFASATAAGGLMFGMGIIGVANAPKYTYNVGGKSFDSQKAAESWIEKNVESFNIETEGYQVADSFFIAKDEFSDYLQSIYKNSYTAHAYVIDTDFNTGANGLYTGSTSRKELEADDRTTYYKHSNGNLESNKDTAINSYISSEVRWSHLLSNANVASNLFATEDEAIEEWKVISANNHKYDHRIEFKFMGGAFTADEDAGRNAAIAAEVAKIATIAEVPATPGTEADYQATTQYSSQRDAWITANTTVDNTDPDNPITTTPTEADYQATNQYSSQRDAWITANPDFGKTYVPEKYSYDGTEYSSRAAAEGKVRSKVGSPIDTRVRWSHDGINFDYDSREDALEVIKTGYSDSAAGAAQVDVYRANVDGSEERTFNTDKSVSVAFVESKLSTIEGLAGATGSFNDYELNTVYEYKFNTTSYYDSMDNLLAQFETDYNIQSVETTNIEEVYKLDNLTAVHSTRDESIAFWKSQIQRVRK